MRIAPIALLTLVTLGGCHIPANQGYGQPYGSVSQASAQPAYPVYAPGPAPVPSPAYAPPSGYAQSAVPDGKIPCIKVSTGESGSCTRSSLGNGFMLDQLGLAKMMAQVNYPYRVVYLGPQPMPRAAIKLSPGQHYWCNLADESYDPKSGQTCAFSEAPARGYSPTPAYSSSVPSSLHWLPEKPFAQRSYADERLPVMPLQAELPAAKAEPKPKKYAEVVGHGANKKLVEHTQGYLGPGCNGNTVTISPNSVGMFCYQGNPQYVVPQKSDGVFELIPVDNEKKPPAESK